MSEVSTVGLDITKQVFQAHGVDASGHVLFRKRLTRVKLIEFFRSQPQCLVALEACGGAPVKPATAAHATATGPDVRTMSKTPATKRPPAVP